MSGSEHLLPQQTRSIGWRLKLLRNLFGYSQKELAAVLNIHRSTYTYYELDKIAPPVFAVILLASYYEITTDYLLGLGEDDSLFNQPLFQNLEDDKFEE